MKKRSLFKSWLGYRASQSQIYKFLCERAFYLYTLYVLSKVTRPRAGRSGARFLARSIDFSLLQHVQIGSGSNPAPLTTSPTGFLPGSKAVNHSPPSNADGKNEQSCSSVPFVRLHGLQ